MHTTRVAPDGSTRGRCRRMAMQLHTKCDRTANLYKIMYDCSCLTRWHAHDFIYINPIIRRVSRMTLINQCHNKDRIRLRKYTSHIEVCNENNIPQWTCPVVHRTWPPIVAEGLNTLQQLLYILCTL